MFENKKGILKELSAIEKLKGRVCILETEAR